MVLQVLKEDMNVGCGLSPYPRLRGFELFMVSLGHLVHGDACILGNISILVNLTE